MTPTTKHLTIPYPTFPPFDMEISSQGLQDAWDAAWKPTYSDGVQSIEQRVIAGALRSVFAGLTVAEGGEVEGFEPNIEPTDPGVRLPRLEVPHLGGATTAGHMRTMAARISERRVMGSNVTHTAAAVLNAYADALDALDATGADR